MANSTPEEKTENAEVAINPPSQSPQDEESKKSGCFRKNILASLIALIVAFAAIIFSLYSIQTNKRVQTNLINENKALLMEVEQLRQKQNTMNEQITTESGKLQQTQNTLQTKLDNLNKGLQTAMQQRLYQNQDWLLLKARYYLEMAQINGHWSDNFNATIALLQQADNLLQQLNTPNIFEVRQAIAKEIAALKALPTVDIAGLLSQLDAAQVSVSNLTIQSTIDESENSAETETPTTSNPSAWRNRLQDSVNLLEKLVVVRRNDEEIKPLMSPLFESILRESIRLNLQEAQWAILNNNPVVYQLALKQATLNLKRTFDEHAPNTAVLIKQLNELQQVKITQEKPIIGLALPLLNHMIDNKELLNKQGNSKGVDQQ